MLFDVPLQMNFHHASREGADYDLSTIFNDTLLAADSWHAVTIVANHNTRPLQSLEAPVEAWFKPLACALILLREQGLPAVFYPDLFGASYEDEGGDGETYHIDMPAIRELEALIRARQLYAHGVQTEWFDHTNCAAFAHSGTEKLPVCVVIMSNGDEREKNLPLGARFADKNWRDFLGHREETATSDDEGNALFRCNAGSVSVWGLQD